jgi:hypothetical protein
MKEMNDNFLDFWPNEPDALNTNEIIQDYQFSLRLSGQSRLDIDELVFEFELGNGGV